MIGKFSYLKQGDFADLRKVKAVTSDELAEALIAGGARYRLTPNRGRLTFRGLGGTFTFYQDKEGTIFKHDKKKGLAYRVTADEAAKSFTRYLER